MARLRTILEPVGVAQRFRLAIRPSMLGRIGQIEPSIAYRAADEFFQFLTDVVLRAMATTDLLDRKQIIRRQLLTGIRVTGRNSLRTLRGRIDAYPWVFPHEYGAKIEPKNSRWLTIPIDDALRPDGSPKFRSASAWRRFGSFIYQKRGSDTKFIARKTASGRLVFLYILVDEIEIPPRLGLNRMSNSMIARLMAAWASIYVEEMVRAGVFNDWLGAYRRG